MAEKGERDEEEEREGERDRREGCSGRQLMALLCEFNYLGRREEGASKCKKKEGESEREGKRQTVWIKNHLCIINFGLSLSVLEHEMCNFQL